MAETLENGDLREGLWDRKFTGVMVCTVPASGSGPDRGNGPVEPLRPLWSQAEVGCWWLGMEGRVVRRPGQCSTTSYAASVSLVCGQGRGWSRCLQMLETSPASWAADAV